MRESRHRMVAQPEFPIQVGGVPVAVAVTPDGKHAYVANQNGGYVSVIDTATNTVVETPIPVGAVPQRGRHHPGWKTRSMSRTSWTTLFR
jgi:YVTN family beta-propeller protein